MGIVRLISSLPRPQAAASFPSLLLFFFSKTLRRALLSTILTCPDILGVEQKLTRRSPYQENDASRALKAHPPSHSRPFATTLSSRPCAFAPNEGQGLHHGGKSLHGVSSRENKAALRRDWRTSRGRRGTSQFRENTRTSDPIDSTRGLGSAKGRLGV